MASLSREEVCLSAWSFSAAANPRRTALARERREGESDGGEDLLEVGRSQERISAAESVEAKERRRSETDHRERASEREREGTRERRAAAVGKEEERKRESDRSKSRMDRLKPLRGAERRERRRCALDPAAAPVWLRSRGGA